MEWHSNKTAAGYMVLLSVAALLVLVMASQLNYVGYSFQHNFISDLGVGSTAGIFNAGAFASGAMLCVAALLARRSKAGMASSVGMVIAGIGLAGVGLYPETTGMAHALFAAMAFGMSIVLEIAFYKVYRGTLSYYSLISGLVGAAALVAMVGMASMPVLITLVGEGGLEEALFYIDMAWYSVLGISLCVGLL